MQPHDQRHGLEARDARHHLGAPLRMQPDQAALLGRQVARLREQLAREAQLADVVKQRAELDLDQLRSTETEPRADGRGGGRDLERVPVGVAVRFRQRLHERSDLRLRIARNQLATRVVREGLPGKDAELPEQLHLPRFELSLLVPAADADRTTFLRPAQDGRGRDRAEAGRVKAPADQVGMDARSGDRGELARRAGRAHDDPGLVEAEHGARVLRQPVEHHARVAQPLGRRHPCR